MGKKVLRPSGRLAQAQMKKLFHGVYCKLGGVRVKSMPDKPGIKHRYLEENRWNSNKRTTKKRNQILVQSQ